MNLLDRLQATLVYPNGLRQLLFVAGLTDGSGCEAHRSTPVGVALRQRSLLLRHGSERLSGRSFVEQVRYEDGARLLVCRRELLLHDGAGAVLLGPGRRWLRLLHVPNARYRLVLHGQRVPRLSQLEVCVLSRRGHCCHVR